ncbi:MAG: hypothetical protein IJW51_07310 [Clostridia bacterium]|nr:hypothetical protein [Clostridia bacterium]
MTDKLLNLIKSRYHLLQLDVGEMATLKAKGMTFTVKAFYAAGLGHISVMRAKGFFGLMKMDTLIINPKDIDLPLYSYDRIYAMGNDTLIVELYDTLSQECDLRRLDAVKDGYRTLPERDPGEHWYDSMKLSQSISKKGKKAQTPQMDQLALEHLSAYLDSGITQDVDVNEKQRKSSRYVAGLLANGGPSTDVFKKALGAEKTAVLFGSVLFGTAE